MGKIAVITDSTSDLNEEFIKDHDVKVIPLQIIHNGKSYRDKVEITYEDIHKDLNLEIPKTSLPFASDIVEVFEQLKRDEVKNVVGVFISSKLSGTFNLVRNIADEYKKWMCVELIDSNSVSMGIGHSIIQTVKAVEQGKSFKEVLEITRRALKNTRTFFVVSTLTYLMKGGRMGKVSGSVGNLLNVKPIIGVDEIETGQYYTIKKVRGSKKSMNVLCDIAKKIMEGKKNCDLAIADAVAREDKQYVEEILRKNENIESFISTSVTPVIAIHTGPGLVGISIHCEEGLDDLRNY